jgi:alpha-beta hydrolase superfamily lysophospholipase
VNGDERPPMDHVTSLDGSHIAYVRSGWGPSIVIIGGALNDHSSAAALAEELGRDLSVITYDRRGRGESVPSTPWSLANEIEDLRALAAIAGEPVYVYGHSSGAVLSIEAALAGVPIRRLVVYEPPYVAKPNDPHAPPADLADRLRATLAGPGGADAAVREFLRLGPSLSDDAIETLSTGSTWPRFLALAFTMPWEAEIVGDGTIPVARLASFMTPTLVLEGSASPPWTRASTAALADALPHGEHVVLEGLDHGGARADPGRVAAEVWRFLLGG